MMASAYIIGIASLKSGCFTRWLNILAIIPPLADSVIAVYALGQVIWWRGLIAGGSGSGEIPVGSQ